jgi:MFS family permease
MSDSTPTPAPTPAPKPSPYAAWQNRDYRRYAAGWFLTMFSKMVETVAVLVYIYDRTDDPLALGWVGLVQALPVILLAIAGGQIADRFDRRRVMVLSFAVSSLVTLGLLVLSLLESQIPIGYLLPGIYFLLAVNASSAALGSPSRAALLPQIIGQDVFTNAVAWNTTVFHVSAMTGPAVGGLIVGMGEGRNTSEAFALALVCRVLSVIAAAGIRGGSRTRPAETVSWQSVVAGMRFVWRTKLILAVITLDLFAVLLGGATYLLPIFARDILQVGDIGVGFLRAAEAIGAVCMGVLIAHLPPLRRAGRTMLWAVAGFGVATIVYGWSENFWLSMAMMFAIGALDNISVVVRHTIVQMLTPDEMRGRVSAVNNIFIVSSNDLGGFESGLTAKLFGPVTSVVGGGIGTLLVVLGAARIWPEILGVGSLKDLKPAEVAEALESADDELAARG